MPFLQSIYEARRHGRPPAPDRPPIETKQVRGFSLIGVPAEDPKQGAVARGSQETLDRQRLHLRLFREAQRVYGEEHRRIGWSVAAAGFGAATPAISP